MPRFLHTADWQIGRQYGRFEPEDAAVLADARFTAIETLARLATQEAVDAVLVAGDVFDAQTVSDRTLHRSFQAMAGYTGPWIVLPGNHDAALAESVWTRAARIDAIPANVRVLTEPRCICFEQAGFAVLPAPLTQRQTFDDRTAWFDQAATPEGLVRIGLAHGSVQGPLAEYTDSANPIAVNRAETARLDYLALGDWHGCKSIDERTWYSGTPEPERFKNNEAGQALLVEIAEPGAEPRVTPRRVGQYDWYSLHRTLTVSTDLDELLAALDGIPAPSVVDVRLDGVLDLAGRNRLKQALDSIAGRHRSLQAPLDELVLQPTDDDIAALQADGYVGDVIQDLRTTAAEAPEQQERETASEALAILAGMLQDQPDEAGAQ